MTQKEKFRLPPVGLRIVKTVISVLAILLVYEYLLNGRNPCFACIGAVYGMGNQFKESFRHGFNRFVGTLLGGLTAIFFYWLIEQHFLPLPDWVLLATGLFCTIYLNVLCGASSAVQPGTVVFFVVLCTQPAANYLPYTIARIIDTGVGAVFSWILNRLWPSKLDLRDGFHWKEAFAAWREGCKSRPQE